ncbi:MAG: SIMPL domain-containing protein [Bacteroidales bacterium]
MKKIALLFLLISACRFTHAQVGEKNFIDQNYIQVTGKAELEIIPDLIYLRIVISERDSRTKEPVAQSEARMIEALGASGVEVSKDLAIKDMSSSFRPYVLSKTDIVLTREYQLTVHDGVTLSKVFQELEKAGISNVRIQDVDHSKMTDYRNQVKVMAMKAAREKASLLSEAIGQSVGRALYIEEENPYAARLGNSNTIMSANTVSFAGNQQQTTGLEVKRITIDYSVMVRFELK